MHLNSIPLSDNDDLAPTIQIVDIQYKHHF